MGYTLDVIVRSDMHHLDVNEPLASSSISFQKLCLDRASLSCSCNYAAELSECCSACRFAYKPVGQAHGGTRVRRSMHASLIAAQAYVTPFVALGESWHFMGRSCTLGHVTSHVAQTMKTF